jgi:ubiquinone/menaquinone biosynthesis C-methylase UbiE
MNLVTERQNLQHSLEEIRDQQRQSWNKFSPGWKKWDNLMMDFLKPMGDEIIQQLNLAPDSLVLDVAAGTGEPGLTIATQVYNGRVIITDLAEHMLQVAIENANARGINNIEILACDVSELPFDDNTFDAISCRFGFMFFPDMALAIKEMTRVLKPGGRIATSVWNGPEKNFWITAIGGTINKHMQLPAPVPEAPGMFRCAKAGLMQNLFQQAGLSIVSEKEIIGKLKCGTADIYWDMMTEVAAPFVAALSKADDAMRKKIRQEVFQLVHEKFTDSEVVIDSSAQVICGQKQLVF